MISSVLRASECRVWWSDPWHEPVSALTSVLSEAELARAAGFHREQDRRRYITGCWLVRTTVAAQLGTSPKAVVIDRGCSECGKAHGKPRIAGTMTPLHVSISHSGNRVAVALSNVGPVGVDVEEVVPAPGGIPEFALSPAEQAALQELPEAERDAGFIRMWVRKEAVLKATGHGLRIPPDQVEVSGPLEEPALLGWPLDVSPSTVQIHPLSPGGGYDGVVALLIDDKSITVSESEVAGLLQTDFPSLAHKAA